jgi:hypothetical protein
MSEKSLALYNAVMERLLIILSKLFVFQAIYGRAFDEGLAISYRTSPVVKGIIKLIIALGLLHAGQKYARFTVQAVFFNLLVLVLTFIFFGLICFFRQFNKEMRPTCN